MTPPEIDLTPGVEFRQIEGPPRKERPINWIPLSALVISLTAGHYLYKFLWSIVR